ncbi:MAG: hypothetical protein ACRBBN_13810 [Methyloligellaceae bacterium]
MTTQDNQKRNDLSHAINTMPKLREALDHASSIAFNKNLSTPAIDMYVLPYSGRSLIKPKVWERRGAQKKKNT